MSTLDYIVIFLYSAGMLLLGGILSRSIKNSSDMFVASKKSPWWLSGLSGYMSFFSSATFVVWGSIAFKSGMVSVSITMTVGISAFLVGLFLAKKWHDSGVSSAAEYIQIRYGKEAVQFYTWFGMVFRMFSMGVALYSFAILVCALMPLEPDNFLRDPDTGNLSVAYATILCGFIVIFYTVAGGLWAVMITDAVQFIVLAVSVLFVVPMSFMKVGGIESFISKAPVDFFSLANTEFTWLFLTGWMAIQAFKIGGEWVFIQRFLSVPTAKDAQKSSFLFGALYLVSPIIWMLPPMIYRTIDPSANSEQAYILACQAVLPAGMLGLMISGMFSATASMIDSELNVFAGVLTRDLYRPLMKPDASEEQLVNIGRILTIVLGAVVVSISLMVPFIGGAERVVLTVTGLLVGPLVLPTIWGLFSSKLDQKAIWASAGISFVLGGILKFGFTDSSGDMAVWVNNNMRTLEVGIGVLVPLFILMIMESLSSQTSEGYRQLQNFAARQLTEVPVIASSFPGQIVSYCIGILSITMFAISLLVTDRANIVMMFAYFLLLLSMILYRLARMQPRPHPPVATKMPEEKSTRINVSSF